MRFLVWLGLIASIATPLCAGNSSLAALDGEKYTLQALVGGGRWLMMNVWSPGCSHCLKEMPALTAFHRNNKANAEVVSIAIGYPGFGSADEDELREIIARYDVPFDVLVADGARAAEFLGEPIDSVPLTFAYDPGGRMVARWHGVITVADIEEIIRDFTPP